DEFGSGGFTVDLRELGWDLSFEESFRAAAGDGRVPARVAAASRGLYRLLGEAGEWLAEAAGRLRHDTLEPGELPAVGDWAAAGRRRAAGHATIVRVLPGRTPLVRKAAGRAVEAQVLAANLDAVLVVAALDQRLNRRRLERYLALAWESGALPVVVLSKADL